MNFQLFQYALPAPPELADLNAYLANQRVASVAQHLVTAPGGPMLVFVVQSVGAAPAAGRVEARVDYKLVLGEAQFAVYERLRRERKLIADAEGVPAYTVFTNAQLADLVRRAPRTVEDLAALDGVGEARAGKYGLRLLALLPAGSPSGAAPPAPVP